MFVITFIFDLISNTTKILVSYEEVDPCNICNALGLVL